MADTKVSALTSLTGAGVDTAADVLLIVDTSATTSKKIIPSELGIALGTTQAAQETATSTSTHVTPATQQYHPSAPKAWGMVATPSTVSASYPGSGVSVVHNSTGNYTVTHGVTFSGSAYAAMATSSNALYVIAVSGKTPTTITVTISVASTQVSADLNFDYVCFGDLA